MTFNHYDIGSNPISRNIIILIKNMIFYIIVTIIIEL